MHTHGLVHNYGLSEKVHIRSFQTDCLQGPFSEACDLLQDWFRAIRCTKGNQPIDPEEDFDKTREAYAGTPTATNKVFRWPLDRYIRATIPQIEESIAQMDLQAGQV